MPGKPHSTCQRWIRWLSLAGPAAWHNPYRTYNKPSKLHIPCPCIFNNHNHQNVHRPATLLAITTAMTHQLPPNMPKIPSETRTFLFNTGHPALAVTTTIVIVVIIVAATAIVAPQRRRHTYTDPDTTTATELYHFLPSHLGCPEVGSSPSRTLSRFRPRYRKPSTWTTVMMHNLVRYGHVLRKFTLMSDLM